MLDESHYQFLKDTVQILITDKTGLIQDSTDTFFHVSKGQSVTDIHPFFYILSDLFSTKQEVHYFHCVQMTILAKKKYFDIRIKIPQGKDQAVIYLHDLTDHYKNVLPIQQNKNESSIHNQTIQRLNVQLEEQRAFKDKFLANVSHEIRTPLNSLQGFINILERSNLKREQLDLVNVIKSSSDSLLVIVNDLLDISKIEAGKLEIKNRRFDGKTFFDELNTIYTVKAESKGLEFIYDQDPQISRFIVSDKMRLRQILVNLLENAINYTTEGRVSFKIYTTSRNTRKIPLIFEITDTGIGIPKEQHESIFESFHQLEKKGLFGGAGLGLSIVKQLAEHMGATLSLESEVDKGSTFRISIPVGISHDQKISIEEKLKKKQDKRSGLKKKYRILLAEDIEANQLLMVKLFSEHNEYSLDIVKNGERALIMLERYEYDLVLMDLTMPIMDGFDATARIRSHQSKKLRKIPIIALTAHTSEEDLDLCKEVGINGYLTKPIKKEVLFQTVDKYLTKGSKKKED